jgi:hypothetical protein
VGAGAVATAKADAARREVRTTAELADADEELLRRGHLGQGQRVGGRLFTERNGIWTDVLHADSLNVVTVEPFSPAYFELLRRLPELADVVQRFDRVVVAGRRVSIRIEAGGRLEVADVPGVVAGFRGR